MGQNKTQTKTLMDLPAKWPRGIRNILIADFILALLFFMIHPTIKMRTGCSIYDPPTLTKYMSSSIVPILLLLLTIFVQLTLINKIHKSGIDSAEKTLRSINRRQNIFLIGEFLALLFYRVISYNLCAIIDEYERTTTSWKHWGKAVALFDFLIGLFAFFILPIMIKIIVHAVRKKQNLPDGKQLTRK